MKKLWICVIGLCLFGAVFADALTDARELAQKGIIVNQSASAQGTTNAMTPLSNTQESDLYRLNDLVSRQEVLGIALKLNGTTLPDSYICKDYFRDVVEWWVCRAVEISADQGIVTRANATFRPQDTVTLAEWLGIIINALNIPFSPTSTSQYDNLPYWQTRLIATLGDKKLWLTIVPNTGGGDSSGFQPWTIFIGTPDTSWNAWPLHWFYLSDKLTRGDFFQFVAAILLYQDSEHPTTHCSIYNDGCNDCTVTNGVTTCSTSRQCLWQGIPSCSACDAGYTLQNNRCVADQTTCVGLGGVEGNYSLPPQYQTHGVCCAGLTSVGTKDAMIVGAPNICANIGDGICDARYESSVKSPDCRTNTFDASICQNYFDGCNSCSNTPSGMSACTMMACMVNKPAYCTTYAAYTPTTQTADAAYETKVKNELSTYASDLSCTTSSQCQIQPVWAKACGGPTSFLRFSTKNVDAALVTTKIQYITDFEKAFNTRYNIVSDCSMMQAPAPMACVSGMCQ